MANKECLTLSFLNYFQPKAGVNFVEKFGQKGAEMKLLHNLKKNNNKGWVRDVQFLLLFRLYLNNGPSVNSCTHASSTNSARIV